MGDRHDYVALEWVKGEIAETLKQARQALESFVENPQDPTRMRFCLAYVHQVHGTLQMVEFYGAALLAEEMEQLAQALMDGRAANQGEALEVLMQAILQLPVYLDRVQSARRDLPLVVMPLLNDLRAARGENLLSETSLFVPDLSGRLPALPVESLERLRTAELPVLLRKLRQMLQMALVGVIRNQDLATNLGYMARVFARLETLCKDAPLGALWQVASGLVEGLANGSIVNGTSVRTLLRQVDRELKRLVSQGADGINQAAPDELAKNMLFYVAKAPAQSPRIRALKQQYRLEDALPDTDVVDEERARLAGPDRDAMRSVVGALCEELVRIKDSLDLFVRSDRSQVAELDSQLAPLKQIADTLAVLGFGQPRKVILDQIDVIHALTLGQQEPSDALLMDVAGALLYVEATLAGMVAPSEQAASEQSHLPTTDVAQVHQLVIKEARNGLEQAKDAIIEFIASQWNHDHLARVPELLTQVRGGLAMIPLPRAATLLNACNRYIQEQLLVRKVVPNWQHLDTLADAITSVEYYLERLSEDHASQGDLILDVAEESLESLGYPMKERPSILDVPEVEPIAPLADPLQDLEVLAAEEIHYEAPAEPLPLPEPDDEGLVLSDAQGEPAVELLANDDNWSLGEENFGEEPEIIDFSLDLPLEADEELHAPLEALGTFEVLPAEERDVLAEDAGLDALSDSAVNWDDLELSELDLPQVELSTTPFESVREEAEPGATADTSLSMADVMAAPAQAINPPAQFIPLSLLPPPADEEPVDGELLEVFVEEAGEVLETIAQYLPRWTTDVSDQEALTEVRRAFHTLKGSGRMVRALVIGELAWSIENLLNRVLDRSIEAGERVLNVIGDVVAVMPELVDEFAARAQRQRDDVDRLAAIAHALARGETPPDESGAADDLADEEALPELEAIDVAAPERASGTDGLDPQLLEIFRNEAEAHLDALVGFLADCAQELPQPVTDDLQRALHTLKGSASMAGILPIAEIATPLEKLFKEYKTNLIDVDLIEAELLHTAEQLFRQGLEQLDTTPLAPIEGAAELLERAQKLHQERLDNIETQRQDSPAPGRDPQMLATFLADGMDTLLDAEDLLRRWREYPAEQQGLSALFEELDTLGRSACLAELPQIDALCQPLLALYTLVQDGRLAVSERFFTEAEAAHEALMSMMDQLAAGLEVVPQPERVAALQALMDEAFDPGAQAVEAPLSADDAGFHDGEVASTLEPEPELTDIPRTSMPESLDREMVAIFLEEAVDILESAGKALERLLADPDNGLALSSLQRDLHTLKGGARMAEIGAIGDLAHELESLYEGLVDRRFSHSTQLSQLLQQSHDRLALLLEQLQHGQPLADSSDLIAAIRLFREGGGQEPPPGLSVDSTPGWDDSAEPAVDSGWLLDAENAHDLQSQPESLAELSPPAEPPDAETSETDDWQLAAQAPEIVEEAQHQAPGPVGDAWTSEPPAPPAVDDRDPELVEIFLEEGFDIMDSSAAALHRWMEDVDNTLEVEALQRDLHTLKGGARMAEISEIGDLAHELEFLYEGVGDGRLRANADLFSLLQACHDRLAEMLEAVRDQRAVPDGQALIQTIRQFRANPDAQLNVPSSVHLQRLEDSRREQDEDAEADILDIFLEEADDLLEVMEASLGHWDASREDAGAIDDMLRILHTLKGGAQLAGQKRLGDMTHDLEQHLSEAQQRGAPWPESLLLDVQSGFDGLQKELGELRLRLGETQAEDAAALAVHVEREMEAEPIGVTPVTLRTPLVASSTLAPVQQESRVLPFVQRAAAAAQEASARRAPQELVKVPADLLEGLVNLAGETSIFRGRVEQQVSDVGFTLGEMDATIDRVRDQLRRLDTETQAQILSRYQAETEKAGYEDFDPLEMDRYSQLQQLSRALFESASDLLDLKETLALRYRDAETLLLQQARVNTELQEGLMRTRMVPFDRLVPRLRRIVRQTASELGKQVEFAVGNAEGEMDRTVLERIVAPLEHMLRNAVDHGIEPVETRRANGKSDVGTIRLTLGREGGDILITLGDDGGGIKLEAVRRKAIERGLMDADADLSDYETLQFILEPGFSTAEKVTQISGRGVGMDVVHSEVKQLGGSMSIESTVGEGTRFLIRLPFTVSVNRALMVLSGEDLYAIPLNTIEGIVRVSPYELEDLYQQGIGEDGQPLTPRFEYAGQPYELKYLGDLLNNGQQPKLVGQSLPLPVILVRSSEHTVAVQVDSLAGSREIVVKSLGPQFAGVHGISGATILGDGRVVVILDLAATIRGLHAHQQMLIHAPRLAGHAPVDTEQDAERPTLVMVVDDSVTVRKVTSRLLERNGMNVMTAKDGVDAISQLQEQMPDIMLLDIEMPRMDGFEVATLVRHDDRLKDLPIIMITSRTGDKHRERAMAIGVNQYLGKPYQESDLLENIDRLVKRHD